MERKRRSLGVLAPGLGGNVSRVFLDTPVINGLKGLEVKRFPGGRPSRFIDLTDNNRQILAAAGFELRRPIR